MRGKRSVLVGSLDVAWARQEGSVKSYLDFSLFLDRENGHSKILS